MEFIKWIFIKHKTQKPDIAHVATSATDTLIKQSSIKSITA